MHVAMCIVIYDIRWGSLAIAKLHFKKRPNLSEKKSKSCSKMLKARGQGQVATAALTGSVY